MRKIVILLAIVAAIVAAALILIQMPPKSPSQTPGPQLNVGKVYIYSVEITGGPNVLFYYIPTEAGLVIGWRENSTSYYRMYKNGVITEFIRTPQGLQKNTYYERLLEVCRNSTTIATVAGERITLSNSQCSPSTLPLPMVRTLEDLLFGQEPPLWVKSGVAQTPFGLATVYINITQVPIMIGINSVSSFEKQVLPDGTIYLLKAQHMFGTQVIQSVTFMLKNITNITLELKAVIDELSKDVVAANGGGLDLLKVAEKIGMSFDGGWPAAIVFFDLRCRFCAELFKYNYTLFQGHKLVLADLVVHPEALEAHQRLRCLYQTAPDQVIPTLRVLYDRFLAGDVNYTDVLPNQTCPVDVQAGTQLAQLVLLAQGRDPLRDLGTPMVVVVYPNGTYTLIAGKYPDLIAKALRG